MTYLDVLEKWAVYSRYDREQKKFNLLLNDYMLHKTGERIEMLLSDYDSTGMLAVIYAKIQYMNMLKDTKLSMFDVLANPGIYEAEKSMFELFNEPVVVDAEREFIEKLNRIYLKITNGKLIGKDDGQREQFLNSIEKVVESINKCNVDLFMNGGEIQNVQNISTKLHIFNTLAECLLNIEKAKDGMYFCFISAGNSADCYFSFFLKSNGTIISINDRVDEAYIGQHKILRNGRWTEKKIDNIFPYEYIFKYSEYDYKGYATKYEIEEDKLELFNLGIEAYMPVVIAMLLIILKYSNKELNLPMHYIDSFLPENRAELEEYSLMVVGESSLACNHNNVDISFDNQKILNGDYANEFTYDPDKNNFKETGIFTNKNQLMVDLWGSGFVFDITKILKSNNIHCLMDKENTAYVPEFIGSEKRLRLQVYNEARQQLAEYIEYQIYNAWVEYGKTEAVKKWYTQALLANKEYVYRMIAQYESDVENGIQSKVSLGRRRLDGNINIYMIRNQDYPGNVSPKDVLNGTQIERWKWLCDITGCVCNTWFIIAPQTWEQIAELTNQEPPKIVKGWNVEGHGQSGNPLLNSVDAVERVCTPFEYKNNDKYKNAYYDFKVAFGFSKRGWNKLKKELLSQG